MLTWASNPVMPTPQLLRPARGATPADLLRACASACFVGLARSCSRARDQLSGTSQAAEAWRKAFPPTRGASSRREQQLVSSARPHLRGQMQARVQATLGLFMAVARRRPGGGRRRPAAKLAARPRPRGSTRTRTSTSREKVRRAGQASYIVD